MDRVDRFAPQLAVDVFRNALHRPRPIERDQGGDVFEGAGPQLAQDVAHALAFHLEHPERLTRGHDVIGRLVIERQKIKLHARPALAQIVDRTLQHGESFQTQEVKFDQPGALNPFHIVLGSRQG